MLSKLYDFERFSFNIGHKIDELTMERSITFFERQCFEKMAHQVATKEGLSIEYDENTTCNVCLSVSDRMFSSRPEYDSYLRYNC